MSEELPQPELTVGARFRVKARGRHGVRLEGRTGVVIGFTGTKNAVRVMLDGDKYPQTLHRSYLLPLQQGNC